jgi:hypothetical protein
VATYVLHQGEFDRKSGKLANLAQSALWRKEVAAQEALLSTASRKTMRLDRLSEYHAVCQSTAEAFWVNRSKARISRAAFGVWSRSTALLDSFWAGVRKGRARDGTLGKESRTLLGYGDGKWKGGRGPHKRVRDSAERVFGRNRVISVDEYNTTKTCHTCGDVLQGIVDRTKNFKRGAPAGAVDRGVKHCARRTCSIFLDRDVNVSGCGRGRGRGRGKEGCENGGDKGGVILLPRPPSLHSIFTARSCTNTPNSHQLTPTRPPPQPPPPPLNRPP